MAVSCTRSSRIADFTALSWSEASQIVNLRGRPEGLAVLPQHPRAERVERPHRDLLRPLPGQRGHPLAHLARGLVGEGHGQDARGIDAAARRGTRCAS